MFVRFAGTNQRKNAYHVNPIMSICKEGEILTDSLSQVGICSTCNHLEECASRKNWKGPITFCEEFDDYLPSKKILLLKDVKAESDILRIGNETSEYMGLCVNCDCRRTCAFPKPEGGVWHCEEYE